MTFVLVDTKTGQQVDRASSMSELEAAKHSLSVREDRPTAAWTIMPLVDFNAFNAPVHNATAEFTCDECGHFGTGSVPDCTCPGCDI